MSHLFALLRCPDPHDNCVLFKVHMNVSIVGGGGADEEGVVGAGVAGVGECLLSQLLVQGAAVAPHRRNVFTLDIIEHRAPGDTIIVGISALIVHLRQSYGHLTQHSYMYCTCPL